MIFIETATTDPSINLAFEEYFLRDKSLGEDVLMLWRSQPAVVVGRFQSIFAEVNLEFARTQSIQILRRISGGGAVYHDAGNLCFSLIRARVSPDMPKAASLLCPIVQALRRLGLVIEATERSDLCIDGKKFSGHAMMVQRDRLLLHGTLLVDADLTNLRQALVSPFEEVETKAIHSVRSHVTNLNPYLPANRTVEQFRKTLKDILFDSQHPIEYQPTVGELSAITALAADKYRSWDWTFGHDPRSRVSYQGRCGDEALHVSLDLDKGQLLACQLDGATPGPVDRHDIEQRLTALRCDQGSVLAALQGSVKGQLIGPLLAQFLPLAPQ